MYQLMIKPFSAPAASLFKFEHWNDAVLAAMGAMEDGYYRAKDHAIIIGDGSMLNVMSDESIERANANAVEAKKSDGLIQNGRHEVKPEDFVLHIQFGLVQLPPLVYRNEESRDEAMEDAIKTKRLVYIFEEEHDHFYLMLGSGTMLIAITGHTFLEKRREALAMHQKQLLQQRANDPKIFLPPGMR